MGGGKGLSQPLRARVPSHHGSTPTATPSTAQTPTPHPGRFPYGKTGIVAFIGEGKPVVRPGAGAARG